MVVDVDVSAETDELVERAARLVFFDGRVECRASVVHLGNVSVCVDVWTVDVLSVAVPRRSLFVDVSDEVGVPECVRGQVIARMVVDLNCENSVVGDATGGYSDELADGEHAKQRAVVVGFALETAQFPVAERGSSLMSSKVVMAVRFSFVWLVGLFFVYSIARVGV